MPAILLGAALVARAAAQEQPAPPRPQGDDVKSLQQRMDELEKKHEQELDELRDQIDELQAKQSPPPAAGAAQSLNAFNPQLTVFGDFLGRWDDQAVVNDAGDRVDDRFWLREAEVDLRAAIDPWADGVLILALGAETPGDYETEVEEGYFTLKKLPLLDEAPLGMKLQAGRFRPSFGRINKIHDHDLPWMDRPPSFAELFGDEGFRSDGLSMQAFVPTPGEGNALEATLQVVNGGDLPAGAGNDAGDPAWIEHLGWFFELAPGHDLEVGESLYLGKFDARGHQDSRVLGVDATWRWKPGSAGEWNSFLLGAELYVASIEQAGASNERPLGWYAWAQWQLDKNLYLGARWDWHEAIGDGSIESRQAGVFLTYYTTEFLRFRLGFEHTESDDPSLDGLNSALLQATFVFGSHPVEPYWVHR
jgi:hypothetical protein